MNNSLQMQSLKINNDLKLCKNVGGKEIVILSGSQILKELNKTIFITPFSHSKLNSNSYNLTLSNHLKTYKDTLLDMKKEYHPSEMEDIVIPENGLILHPNRLYLGSTEEYTYTSSFVPIIEGRSSLARLGLFVHITAGLGEAGFSGHWTLELSCVQPIKIYPHISICQIFYNCILGEIDLCKSEKYQNSTEAEPSKIYKEVKVAK